MLTLKNRQFLYDFFKRNNQFAWWPDDRYSGKVRALDNQKCLVELEGPNVCINNPLADHVMWAVLLHEIGHIINLHPFNGEFHKDKSERLQGEIDAWGWAIQTDRELFDLPEVREQVIKDVRSYQHDCKS